MINVDYLVKNQQSKLWASFLTKGNDSSTGKAIVIDSANNYMPVLDSLMSLLMLQRQQLIVDQLLELNAFSNESEIDSALLQEVCFLVENPTVLGVPFNESFTATKGSVG